MASSLSPVVLGWESECLIGLPNVTPTLFFGFKGGSMDLEGEDNECGDSISGVYKQHKTGRRDVAINWEFYEKHGQDNQAENVWPYLQEDAEVSLWVYVKGTAGGEQPYKIPSFVLNKYSDRLNKDGMVEGNFSGHSNGPYEHPDGN
jgi:hypothetical protein